MRCLRVCTYLGAALLTVFYLLSFTLWFILPLPAAGQTWKDVHISLEVSSFQDNFNISVAAGGLLIDLWLFLIPLAAIYRLQLHRSTRLGLIIMFSSGLVFVDPMAYKMCHR